VTLPMSSFWLLAAVGTVFALTGCGSSADPAADGTSDGHDASTGGGDPCATPNLGCPCTQPGQTLDCGQVAQTSGDYVTCSEGTRTCAEGAWGACIGQYVTTKALPSGGGIRIQGLNPSSACTNNPCDPACNAFVDNPSGLDAGKDSGLVIADSGVTLFGTPVSTATCQSLQITPNTAPTKDLVVTSMAPSPNTVAFTAAILPANCFAGTPTFLWSIDQYSIAQVSSSGLLTLAVPIAGPITVSAYAGTLTASVVCNVTVNVVDTSSAPTGYSNTQFPTATGAVDNLAVLYPYPGTVFPLGLPSPLIQWQNNNSPATTASAVKVSLRFPTTGTPLFSWSEIVPELQTAPTPTLAGQPRATIPQAVWQAFQQTVIHNSGALGGDATFVIQRYVGGVLYAEVPTTIHFANGQLKGNIFYNSYGTNLVKNFGSTLGGQPFGAATLQVAANGTSPTVVVGYNDATLSGAGCRVCHNAAAGGTLLLSNSYLTQGNSGSGSEATTFTYNATLSTPSLIQGSESLVGGYGVNTFTYAALSPDGTYLYSSSAPASSNPASALFTSAGVSITSNAPSALHAATPAFSPDAAHVAFNFYSGSASPLSSLSGDGKSLAMMDFVPPKTFSNFRVLSTPTSLYSVWPTFLPPGQNGVVYQNEVTANGRDWAGTRSQCDGTGTCNNIGATGELWWVSTGTTPVATRLTNMNGGSYMPRSAAGANYHGTSSQNGTYYEEVYNYEPAALPVTLGGYSWVAFTSRRLYGNVATIDPFWSDPRFQNLTVQPTTKKIWIAAVATNPTPGTDPSYPAFYLPGQELLAGNSRAYFTLASCEAAGAPTAANLCTSNLDCCGGTASPATAVCQLDPPPLANPPTSHCVAASTSTCAADGSSCTSDAQCCNFVSGSRCGSGTCNPAPAIDTYVPSPFVTSYQATCGLGTTPVWRFFYWQSVTPTGSSIVFTAATSTNGTTWGASVPIGTAAAPPIATTTWTSGSLTVDQALRAGGQTSQAYLQVTGILNPDPTKTTAPVLTNWELNYDCVASE
jgi:hypothetical protein